MACALVLLLMLAVEARAAPPPGLYLDWSRALASLSQPADGGRWVSWAPTDSFVLYNSVTGAAHTLAEVESLPNRFRVADIARPPNDPSVAWFTSLAGSDGVSNAPFGPGALRDATLNLSKLKSDDATGTEWTADVQSVKLNDENRKDPNYEGRIEYWHNFKTNVGSWAPYAPEDGWVVLVPDGKQALESQLTRLGLIAQWRGQEGAYRH